MLRDSFCQDLKESYLHNLCLAKYLHIKTCNLQKYLHVKRNKLLGQQAKRLIDIRKRTNYHKDLRDLLRMVISNNSSR